jgi:uncharacterized membrane protein
MTSKRNSLAKTATYFVADSALTGFVSLLVTRKVSTALSIAMGVQTSEVALYYFHERVWARFHRPSSNES